MSNMEKFERQREAEKLLNAKDAIKYSEELVSLLFENKSDYRFSISVGNEIEDRLLCVTAYDKTSNNSTISIYGFDSKKRREQKIGLIKDMFNGKIELKDFSDMKFY